MRRPESLSAILFGLLLTLACRWASAHERETHEDFSESAANAATNFTSSLSTFGLSSIEDQIEGVPIKDLIRKGAYDEDDTFSETFARYKHHFYDPTTGEGFGGILWTNSGLFSGMPAPDWALDGGKDLPKWAGTVNAHSFAKARGYYAAALRSTVKSDRDANLALMFRSLGQVIHIVEDMAQPQHKTRTL